MTLAIRLALAGAGLALGLLAAGHASAATKSPAMQACSDEWATLKADDKVPAGQTWPKFWSQCAKDYAAAHPADAASAADKTAAAPAEPPPAKKAKTTAAKTMPAKEAAAKPVPAPAAASAKGKSPAMQACSDDWADLKADGKVPAGQTWPKFWSQCAKDYAAAHPADAASAADKTAAAPAEPPPAKKTKAAAAKTAPAKEMEAKPAPAPAAASAKGKSPAMQACSDDWADLKADGKVPAGQTWPKFWSQCAKDYAAAHPADAASAADKTAAAPAEPPPAKKTKAAAAKAPAAKEADTAQAGKGASSAMQACSDQWAALKADDKVPAGQTWPKFWSQCSKDYAAAHPAEVPAKTAAKTTAAKTKAATADDDEIGGPLPEPEVAAKLDPDKPVVAGKREPTPGQKAAWARMRSCGAEWQAEKKADTLPAGAKWPQYWSDCNKRLKAKGQ